MRRKAIGLLLGAALLSVSSTTGRAQQRPDPMLGSWRAAGQTVTACLVSTSSGAMRVVRHLHDEAYAVRVVLSWRHAARPGCPALDAAVTRVAADGILEGAGNSMTLRIASPVGEYVGHWTYELEQGARAMRYVCQECAGSGFRWVRGR